MICIGRPVTHWEFLCLFMPLPSRERPPSAASRSEIKRWIQNKAVLFNHEPAGWDEMIDYPIFSLVLFPKSKHRTTLW